MLFRSNIYIYIYSAAPVLHTGSCARTRSPSRACAGQQLTGYTFNDYLDTMSEQGTWGGTLEIIALSTLLDRKIWVHRPGCELLIKSPAAQQTGPNQQSTHLHLENNHFQLLTNQLEGRTLQNTITAHCAPTSFPSFRGGTKESAAQGWPLDRKSTRLNSSHSQQSRMPSSA